MPTAVLVELRVPPELLVDPVVEQEVQELASMQELDERSQLGPVRLFRY
jgi:hypothetical protein